MKLGINAAFSGQKPVSATLFTNEVGRRLSLMEQATTVFAPYPLWKAGDYRLVQTPEDISGPLNVLNSLSRLMFNNTILPYLLKEYAIDVLFCPNTEFPVVTTTPIVVTVYDLNPVHAQAEFGLIGQYFRSYLEKLAQEHIEVITMSEFIKNELVREFNLNIDKIHVIGVAVDTHFFKPVSAETKLEFIKSKDINSPYIMYFGTLFPYKNLKTLLKAFFEVCDRIPHKLVIIGERDHYDGELPEDERLIYIDSVTTEEHPMWYSASDIFIEPSLSEGSGMKLLEAMASGVPVISSNNEALYETGKDIALFFKGEDAVTLAKLILMVARDNDYRCDMIAKGLEYAKNCTWEKTAESIYSICEGAYKKKCLLS
ncbi:glycosyltransferase family 4 protein [Candidatus Magnetomonas plexicatena]|uniref:glycosyltransferase family 4 protein n=1 Tax=Candidatus Magnetomonas plexicatena TaxID=2552947 RepID=UPI001C76AAE3|nr:glycosyltransferase family 4 protein [Nitrospirales bacterium LBB_01]